MPNPEAAEEEMRPVADEAGAKTDADADASEPPPAAEAAAAGGMMDVSSNLPSSKDGSSLTAAASVGEAAEEEMAPLDVMEGINRLLAPGGPSGIILTQRGGSSDGEDEEEMEEGAPRPGIRVVFGGLGGLNGM